jgi:hypothetical protein
LSKIGGYGKVRPTHGHFLPAMFLAIRVLRFCRRRLQFRLRTALFLLLAAGATCGAIAHGHRRLATEVALARHFGPVQLERVALQWICDRSAPEAWRRVIGLKCRRPDPAVVQAAAQMPGLKRLYLNYLCLTDARVKFRASDLFDPTADQAADTPWLAGSIPRVDLRPGDFIPTLCLSDADIRLLVGLRELERLELNHQPLTDDSVASLSQLTTLVRLELNGTKISAEGFARLQAALPHTRIEH